MAAGRMNDRRSSPVGAFGPPASPRPGLVAAIAIAAAGGLGTGACAPQEEEPLTVDLVDSVLIELGGAPAEVLSRSQRWRLVSSVGPGLPPPGYERENLPEPESRSAGLMEAYCLQCHWMAAPQMHSAEEWPTLLRRMYLRAETLGNRLGGPLVTELVGSEFAVTGMGASIVPSEEDRDSLLAYVTKHALPVADPAEIEGPEAETFADNCSQCHEVPSPTAHTMEEWNQVLIRMNANYRVMGLEPMSQELMEEIRAFLAPRAAAGG